MDRKIDIPDRQAWLYNLAKLSWGKIIALLTAICIGSIALAMLLIKAIIAMIKH